MINRKLKVVSVFTALVLLLTMVGVTGVSAKNADIDYAITNPYEAVDWATWGQYKGDLHCHTIASDGSNNYYEMIEEHYAQNFNLLSITDHGTTDMSWVDVNTVPALAALGFFKAEEMGTTVQGLTQERYNEITTPGADGKTMIRIPYGNELNCTSFNNAHVNTWFGGYGNGILGGTSDYETAIAGAVGAGGLCVINHPGEYTSAKSAETPELAYNSDYDYYIDKYTSLLLKYEDCIGIDINSKTDGRTKNDRKLWDILLQNCLPNGRSVMAIATSDAHKLSVVGSGYTTHVMPELTVENTRTSLETGSFFANSIYIKNPKELAEIGAAIGEDLGTSWMANTEIAPPKVTSITVNDAEDSITVIADNAKLVRWIADGNVIATGNTVDLDDYSDQIGMYVRAEVFGDGGILYTQAFSFTGGEVFDGEDFSDFTDFGSILVFIRNVLLKVADRIPGWEIIWKALTGNESQI